MGAGSLDLKYIDLRERELPVSVFVLLSFTYCVSRELI